MYEILALALGLSVAVAASYLRFSVPASLALGGTTCLAIAALILADVIPV